MPVAVQSAKTIKSPPMTLAEYMNYPEVLQKRLYESNPEMYKTYFENRNFFESRFDNERYQHFIVNNVSYYIRTDGFFTNTTS